MCGTVQKPEMLEKADKTVAEFELRFPPGFMRTRFTMQERDALVYLIADDTQRALRASEASVAALRSSLECPFHSPSSPTPPPSPPTEPMRWTCAHGLMFPDECQAPDCIAEDKRQAAREPTPPSEEPR